MQWLLARDTAGVLRFAALQGDAAAGVRARHRTTWPEKLDSIVLVEGEGDAERVTFHSHAVFRICGYLPFPWRAAAWLTAVPAPLADLGYKAFARVRYLVWGRRESCRIPTPAQRLRFLT